MSGASFAWLSRRSRGRRMRPKTVASCSCCHDVGPIHAARKCHRCYMRLWEQARRRVRAKPQPVPIVVGTCARRGCNKPVLAPRRKFCSVLCGRLSHRQRQIDLLKDETVRQAQRNKATRKQRTCLRCDRTFMSEGNWNRVCPRCARNAEDNPPPAVQTGRFVGHGQHIHET